MAMNLTDLLQGQLDDNLVGMLAQGLGGADQQQTASAAQGVISTLASALARNAAQPGGAEALNNALERDHDGSIFDHLGELLGGQQVAQERTSMMNGAGIIGHILGNRQSGATDMISKMSGMDSGQVGSLMTMLAPIVLGALGNQKKQQGLGMGDLAQILSGSVQQAAPQRQEMGLISQFLDQDGDGSVVDDLLKMGGGLLGNFLKK